jgi:YbbR domain-containing protein
VRPLDFGGWRRIATPIGLALVSLVAAIALWVAVTDAENPNRVAVFSGGIEVQPVNVPDGLAVASIREPIVSVRIAADEDTFRRLTTANFRAEVDLSGVRQASTDQFVIADVVGDEEVEIIEVSPAFVTVTLEPVSTRQVPVQSNLVGSPPQGFTLASVSPDPGFVNVTGATSLVQLVANAGLDVNLTGLRASLQQVYPLIARDARGADIRGVRIEPGNANVRVEIVQQEVTLAMTIVPLAQGRVADGYNLVAVSADPPAIAVSGTLEALQAVPYITTEPVDVTNLRADLTRNVRLRLPAGLQTSRDSVNVRLRVVPAQGEITFSVAPQVTGIPEGMTATLQTSAITLRLSGELPTLRALTPGSVRATVSVSGLGEGVHVLTPATTAPQGVQVVASDPAQVVVVLRR